MKRPDQPRPTLRASAVAVPPKHWLTRASDASPTWLGLPALAGAPRLPWSLGLRHSPSQLPRQAGRSDLCSQHQHGNTGHSACFVIRDTQRCWISQVCRQMARDAGLVALTAAHAPSYLPLMITASMQWVCGYAAWVLLCQIARKWSKRTMSLGPGAHGAVCSCMCSFLCVLPLGATEVGTVVGACVS